MGMPTVTRAAMHIETSPFSSDLMALARLMHLCSVSLPVGAYSFSQGLEYAIDAGWTTTSEGISVWLSTQLEFGLVHLDLPVAYHCHLACHNLCELKRLNDLSLACRETRELRLNDLALAEAFNRLLPTLDVSQLTLPYSAQEPVSYPVLFAQVCAKWGIEPRAMMLGYAWSWLENQVMAASKIVPLGQTAAQTLLTQLQPLLPSAVNKALTLPLEELGASLPGLALASSLHETQYSRLFRS